MKNKFFLIGEGRNRIVYLAPSQKYVLKYPKNEEGIEDNILENHRYKNRSKFKPFRFARCRLIPNSYLLVMEAICLPTSIAEMPHWTFKIDCMQAGFNKDNDIVAYDYALLRGFDA